MSPLDVISEARGAVASLGEDAGAAEGRQLPATNNPRELKRRADAQAQVVSQAAQKPPAEQATQKPPAAQMAQKPLAAQVRHEDPTDSSAQPTRPSVSKSKVARPSVARLDADCSESGQAPRSRFGGLSSSRSEDSLSPRPKVGEKATREKPRGARRVVRIALIAVVCVVVAACGAFSAYRWLYGNDATDFQGTWYVEGTDTPIVITEGSITLNDEVAYSYMLDAGAKTLSFTFGNLQGEGRYRFSLDRSQLAVMDGTFGWWDTLASDFTWVFGALVAAVQGDQSSPAAGNEDAMLLCRISASQEAAEEAARVAAEGTGNAADGSAGSTAADNVAAGSVAAGSAANGAEGGAAADSMTSGGSSSDLTEEGASSSASDASSN